MGWVLKLNASSSGCCEERIGTWWPNRKAKESLPFGAVLPLWAGTWCAGHPTAPASKSCGPNPASPPQQLLCSVYTLRWLIKGEHLFRVAFKAAVMKYAFFYT